MTPEAYKEKVRSGFQAAVDHSEFYVRIDHDTLPKLLESGRFKSQFETGTGHGLIDKKERRAIEELVMGLSKTTENHERPIYGYLSTAGHASYGEPYRERDVEGYGSVSIRLKPDVRDRATVTTADSLIAWQVTVASPARNVSADTMPWTWGPHEGRKFMSDSPDDVLKHMQQNWGFIEGSPERFEKQGHSVASTQVDVYRAGSVYLVRCGDSGRIVTSAGANPEANFQSILAHCNIQEEWAPANNEDLPQTVRAVIEEWGSRAQTEIG
jgi:hypothetical protein